MQAAAANETTNATNNESNIELTAGGITATGTGTGFQSEESAYTPKQTPPRDEGVENTKTESSDEDLYKFFGKETEEVLGIEPKENNSSEEDADKTDGDSDAGETGYEDKKGQDINSTVQSPQPSPVSFTQEQVDDIVAQRLAEEVQKFQHINTFFEEYQKDPYGYIAKNSPHLFEKFDEVNYVREKLLQEFGEFTPDPNRVYQIGTTDYAFRMRQDQLLNEAQSLKSQAFTNVQEQQRAVEEEERNYKAAKAQALGLDISTFESRIWNQLKSMDNVKALDALIDGIIYKQKLEEKTTNIQAQIDLTKAAPSPSNIAGTGRTMEGDKELAMLKRMFADGFE